MLINFDDRSGPMNAQTKVDSPQRNSTRRHISLDLLLPEAPVHTPMCLPDPAILQRLTNAETMHLMVEIPHEDMVLASTNHLMIRRFFTVG